MSTDRRFCRFTRGRDPYSLHEIPLDGFCLSSFLVLTSPSDPDRVIVGRMDPNAPWDHLGGLGPDRVEAHCHGWLLPSSQLLFGEAPKTAARRILAEQLEGIDATLSPPIVTSEVYAPKRFPDVHQHWDIGFVFRGRLERDPPTTHAVWTELRLIDPRSTSRADFARSHEDVLDLVGWKVGSVAERPGS